MLKKSHISQSVITVIHSKETTDLTELTAISFLTQVSLLQTHVHWALMLQDRLSSILTNGHSSFLIQQPVQFSSSVVSNSLQPHGLQHASPPCPSPTPEFILTHGHWVGDAIQPPHPLSSPSPPIFSLSQHQGLFKWVSSSHQWAKYWSFSFNISPSKEHLGLISLRMDWLDLLTVQGTLKSLLQFHSSKASILQCSAFFIVQFSHPYMTTGETIALTDHCW